MVQAVDEIIHRDLPQAFQLLREMNENVQQVTRLVDNMLVRVKSGEMSTDKGLSFLEMKYHMLLSYLINLTYVVLRKCSGRKIEDDPAIDRLVEIRTVLEKMRPIDHKLKYQIDKLVKTAVSGSANEQDPTRFRANPENLMIKLNESEESESDSDEDNADKKEGKKGVYVPPKLAAVHYDGDESKAERQQRLIERARKRALNSSVMQELREEYLDSPTEVTHVNAHQAVLSNHQRRREEYEENYFTRLPLTKQDRHRSRKMVTVGTLGDELTRFGDLRALQEGEGISGPSAAKIRRTSKSKGKKGFKKRKFH
ncbi:neuroguidin [Anabrus simplex]|uniref:neuroguidin n=1 Tax=Anabrus simplex TaxID=316456 RepID=UPI0034DCF413